MNPQKKTPAEKRAEKVAKEVGERMFGKRGGVINLRMSHADPKLLPCPFCGCTKLQLCNTHTPSYWIECSGCEAQVSGQYIEHASDATHYHARQAHQMAKRSAIEAWNRRV